MIIVLAPNDDAVIQHCSRRSRRAPTIYGQTRVAILDAIPQLTRDEDLFLVGHGTPPDNSRAARIGDSNGDFGLDGDMLWETYRLIFSPRYRADVYIHMCAPAGHETGLFSLVETFTARSASRLSNTRVFGRTGTAAQPLPRPGSELWRLACQAQAR